VSAGAFRLTVLALALAGPVGIGGTLAAEEPPRGGLGRPPPAPKPRPKPAPEPATVLLPDAGAHPASRLLELLAKASGRKVLAGGELLERDLLVSAELGGSECTLEELRLLLAVQQVFLREDRLEDGTPAWRASRLPPVRGAERAPRLTRVFSVEPRHFDRAVSVLERHLAARSDSAEAGRLTMASSRRASRVIIGAEREAGFAEIAKLLASLAEIEAELETERPRWESYRPRRARAAELRESLLAALLPAERDALRIVVPRSGNVVLLRGPRAAVAKALGILERSDQPPPRPLPGSGGEPRTDPASGRAQPPPR
jgi:hypothetical protein